MIRVLLPVHLGRLARTGREVAVEAAGTPPTIRTVLDALEFAHPVLRGTIRDHVTKERRPYIRFFACGRDLSLLSQDTPVPADVAAGREAFAVVGAMAGG